MRLITQRRARRFNPFPGGRRRLALRLGVLAILLVAWLVMYHRTASTPTKTSSSSDQTSSSAPSADSKPKSVGLTHDNDPTAQDQAASLSVVVNKGRILPSNYVPANLVVPNVTLRRGS